jgi:hypothetical protein
VPRASGHVEGVFGEKCEGRMGGMEGRMRRWSGHEGGGKWDALPLVLYDESGEGSTHRQKMATSDLTSRDPTLPIRFVLGNPLKSDAFGGWKSSVPVPLFPRILAERGRVPTTAWSTESGGRFSFCLIGIFPNPSHGMNRYRHGNDPYGTPWHP